MTDPKALLDAGHLDDAVVALTQAVKAKPTDLRSRIFLFEALCFQGAYDRAVKQLDAIEGQSDGGGAGIAIEIYRELIAGERARQQVFREGALPKFFFPPPPYVEQYVMLVHRLGEAPAEAVALLASAEEATPAFAGTRGGQPFASLRDADDRTAPVLEVLHNGGYLWLPFAQIRRLKITPPTRLRELLWVHAKVETIDQSVGDVFLPTMYPGSWEHPRQGVRLGRETEWRAIEDQMVVGAGGRVLLVDGEEVPLLELGDLVFEPAAEGVQA